MAYFLRKGELDTRMDKDDPKSIQSTSRSKSELRDRAMKMSHDSLVDHVMGLCDEDCEICNKGESGDLIDNDDEGEGEEHDYGTRSSKGHEHDEDIDEVGSSVSGKGEDAVNRVKNKMETEYGMKGSGANLTNVGDRTYKSGARELKENLLKHGHSTKHPGFAAVQKQIAKKSGVSQKAAGAILAARSRSASKAAHKANPRLNRVKG